MSRWIDTLCDVVGNGESACLVTVANIRGSAPREAGARMVVTPTATVGTIGGGQLEHECTRLAVERIRNCPEISGDSKLRTFPLGSRCGQCCGGVVDVLIDHFSAVDAVWLTELRRLHDLRRPFVVAVGANGGRALITADLTANEGISLSQTDAAESRAHDLLADAGDVYWDGRSGQQIFYQRIAASDFHIAIFGAGHVGSATVATLATLDSQIRWIDSRRNMFPTDLPRNVTSIESENPAREVAAMPPASFYLVMTHSHPLDFEICDQVLNRRDALYCGLIGSRTKRRRFENLMRKQGATDEVIADLTCPIGLHGITGKRPQEIAIAVAAELLQIRGLAAGNPVSSLADNVHVI